MFKAISEATLLRAEKRTFTGNDGKLVAYSEATILSDEGEVLTLPISKDLIDSILSLKNVKGKVSIIVAPNFKGRARVFMFAFTKI